MMNALAFEQLLAESWPPDSWGQIGAMVAVSGGADSVALLCGLARLRATAGGTLVAAHFNHGLRGAEADADEAFVVHLCRTFGIECRVGRPDRPLTDQTPDGLEAAARGERYEFLRQAAEQAGARYLACAHTADDQVETILHRILRGTGVGGLTGMPRVRALSPAVTLIRPMLTIRRAQVREYLAALGQPFREDLSNEDLRFTRNRLRHQLLPILAEQYNPEVSQALLRLGSLAREVQETVDGLVDQLAERALLEQSTQGLRIDAVALAGQPRYLVRETLIALWRRQGWPLQSMGHAEWDLLAQLAADALAAPYGPTRKRVFPGAVVAESAANQLRLSREAR